MTFTVRQSVLGTAAEPIGTATLKNTHALYIYNDSNKSIFVGGPDVTVANGFHIPATTFRELRISNGDVLWGVSNDVDGELHIYDYQVDP